MTTSIPSARSVAFDLLAAVLRQKKSLDQALSENSNLGGLEVRDRGFARSITATTLRRLGQIDALIDIALDRPIPKKAQGAHDLLRLGLTQLLFLGTPPHAAVSTTMDLAQAHTNPSSTPSCGGLAAREQNWSTTRTLPV